MKFFRRSCLLLPLLFVVSIPLVAGPEIVDRPVDTSLSDGPSVWLTADGTPLRFESDEDILDYLSTAQVVSWKYIGSGKSGARKVTLEKDGIVFHAAFRDICQDVGKALMGDGTFRYNFRDDAIFEVAAYRLSRLLGLNTVPPVVERVIYGKRGTLQIWVEKSMTEGKRLKRDIQPLGAMAFYRQVQNMRIFDNLIYNEDRNLGNILIDADWKIWFIDHTRAFRRHKRLNDPARINGIERGLWDRLRNLSDGQVKASLAPYLKQQELRGLLKRKAVLIDHIQKMIASSGENRVLFSM